MTPFKFKKTPTDRQLSAWNRAIDQAGNTSIKVSILLEKFGHKSRGPGYSVAAAITSWLRDNHRIYVDQLDDPALEVSDSVKMYREEIVRIGKPEVSELALMNRAPDICKLLGVSHVANQYSPKGTPFRIDILGEQEDALRLVVIELKCRGGDGRGVEQLLRYVAALKIERPEEDARAVLVTNETDLPTRLAFVGLERFDNIEWWLYGLTPTGQLDLKQVSKNVLESPWRRKPKSEDVEPAHEEHWAFTPWHPTTAATPPSKAKQVASRKPEASAVVESKDLRPVNIPSANASLEDILQFARTFDGYQQGSDIVTTSDRDFERWSKDGGLPRKLDALRLALFRRERRRFWFGVEGGKQETEYIRALVGAIRRQLDKR